MRCPHLTKPKAERKDLNFKVPPDFHHEFKKLAVEHRMSGVELLRQALDLYQKVHGPTSKH
jgi:hypothetical protein